MRGAPTVAERLFDATGAVLGGQQLPVRIRAWDGSTAGPPGAPTIVVRSPRALRRLLWAPGEVGLGRAYVAGDIDLEGDVLELFAVLSSDGPLSRSAVPHRVTTRDRVELARSAVALRAVGPPPSPPPEEISRPRRRHLHTRDRDARAVGHHYDVGNDFYSLVLGPSLVYSCAVWAGDDVDLDAAQEAKLDLVCRKLGLAPGMRLLDVGCGWGSMALHAARRYGADVVGVTVSAEQAGLARQRVAEAGLGDRVTIRMQDYRDVDDGPFDAVSSIGMAEHVGRDRMPEYVDVLCRALRPGGRLLHHAIAWSGADTGGPGDSFITRYVFPDGELLRLAETVAALEGGGLEVLDVEALRRHYALTLRAWVERLEKNWDAAVGLAGAGRARVWRLYMAGSALAFETGKLGVNQVLAQRPGGEPPPLRRTDWI
ncbi:MAG TPA: cyclopropane-fatty-acyl-phospholipid synthase family protein [Blastococcus sp.]|nr:cyclopropane-fatty-acyl-phospholipid synthase family protein [Blastococcus sp.]